MCAAILYILIDIYCLPMWVPQCIMPCDSPATLDVKFNVFLFFNMDWCENVTIVCYIYNTMGPKRYDECYIDRLSRRRSKQSNSLNWYLTTSNYNFVDIFAFKVTK